MTLEKLCHFLFSINVFFSSLFIPLFVTFVIAYPISMLEYGYRKFRSNYLLLFKISFPFHIYGIAHGFLAMLLYWVLYKKNFLPTGDVAAVLNPLTIGFGIKGLTNLNFYNIASTSKKTSDKEPQITPVGPKLIMDSIEKYSEVLIEEGHDHYLDEYIQGSIQKHLENIDKNQIAKEIPKYLPHSIPKIVRLAFVEEVEKSIKENSDDIFFAMRLFVDQYGLNRYKKFISGIRNS